MARVNFSVPEKVKREFNAAFAGENKSAVIAELMLRAVQERRRTERRRTERRAAAIEALLEWRRLNPPASDAQIDRAGPAAHEGRGGC